MTRRRRRPPLFLLLLLLLSSAAASFARCLPGQSSALLQLKRGFSFSPLSSSNLTSWLPGSDCCIGWEGVACDDRSSGMVTTLDLSGRSISGKLDPSLFNLTSLVFLDLSSNSFGPAPFPTSFDRLPKLTYLNLSNAGFTGQVPASISLLTNLVSLDLSTFYLNERRNSSPLLRDPDLRALIGNLRHLTELYLDGINISADGTEWCTAVSGSAPGLKKLSMVGCSLSGPIDASLSGLRSLLTIRLDQNNLNSEVPDFFSNFSSLSELHLSNCGLKGPLPDSILKLGNLTVVDVSNNRMLTGYLPEFPSDSDLHTLLLSNTKLTGSLPESIGDLKSLAKLQATNCQFTGRIPASIGKLTQLVHLDLSCNNFSGEIPSDVSWGVGISDIVLAYNNFNGSIPSSFGDWRLSNLTKLDLQNNLLSGSIPMSLFSLPALEVLVLRQNRLSGHLGESLNASSTLSILDLSENALQGEIPASIFNLSGLKFLALGSNNFSGTLKLDLFGNLRNLSSLDLSYNMLSIQDGEGSSSLSLLKLGTLKLAACNLTELPGFLRYQEMLRILDLSNNRIGGISGVIPLSICQLRDLKVLYLSNNFFNGSIPTCLMDGSINLNVLNLRGNQIRGTMPRNVSNQCSLQTININRNQIEGKLPRSLNNCKMLEVLDVGNNYIVDAFPSWLTGLNNLRVLVLKSNGFYGPIGHPPKSTTGADVFPMLQILDISSNYFSGTLPSEFFTPLRAMMVANSDSLGFRYLGYSDSNFHLGYSDSNFQDRVTVMFRGMETTLANMLTIFTYIDLSNNRFEGRIPETIGGLKSLYVLNMSHNLLEGQIPQSLRGLRQLESLDLSANNLSGEIPPALTSVTFLSFLNLSGNSLVGSIPQIGQFQTFGASAFDGNEGLCGPPLPRSCIASAAPLPRSCIASAAPLPRSCIAREPLSKTDVIVLAISAGSGFGSGFGAMLLLQVVQREKSIRRASNNPFR